MYRSRNEVLKYFAHHFTDALVLCGKAAFFLLKSNLAT